MGIFQMPKQAGSGRRLRVEYDFGAIHLPAASSSFEATGGRFVMEVLGGSG
ncbi:hypothetical protein ZHAS_00016398 [Anopheles sinensis]|uniref:Uncharacterized protein n=1 Tax=Anopheles sinensis TaxID=74873 RepID=A0A084WDH8_ANOSI|nr:hypothetical protein ZHAS_00016398 [Anopheles sinensis]